MLFWKLLWLHEDASPRAKDLYDAVVLAEHVVSTVDLDAAVDLVTCLDGRSPSDPGTTRRVDPLDWQDLQAGYPEIHGDGAHHHDRLATALRTIADWTR